MSVLVLNIMTATVEIVYCITIVRDTSSSQHHFALIPVLLNQPLVQSDQHCVKQRENLHHSQIIDRWSSSVEGYHGYL